MDLIKISDLTNQLDISSRSLRYYEQMGLIKSIRLENEKYRYYDANNIERLKQIIVLRKMQIPIKDIIRIYESEDMSVVVESFVNKINTIDDEVNTLSELKRIINEFLQTMLRNGIKKISALPLIYEEMDKKLEVLGDHKQITYDELNKMSEKLTRSIDTNIVDLPPMQVLSSRYKETGDSNVEAFWDYLNAKGLPIGLPGRHEMFEYQNDAQQTIIIQKIENNFVNDSPFDDYYFTGGLFAVSSVFVDENISAFHRNMIKSFDTNLYYEVDYRHGGGMRHESLVESVLSPDEKREKVNLFLAIKKRLPDASLYDPNEQLEHISVQEIEEANPILWETNVEMDKLKPIDDPYYSVNEKGEAEFIAYISKRFLSTNIEVRLPFRVDIEFMVGRDIPRFGYSGGGGSVRFFHGNEMFGINMNNNADSRLSQEAICFNQPIFGDYFKYPKQGKINYNVYNKMTWIAGEKHFAVIINNEVRYCGVNFPYMTSNLRLYPLHPIILGSDGWDKIYFKDIRVSQLKQTPKLKIKEGVLTMITKRSNNIIPNIHQLITMHYGENYWFNGCAKYVMECLGEPGYDYWFFAGLTGDNFAQTYALSGNFFGDGVVDFLLGSNSITPDVYFEKIFETCGYASTYVYGKELRKNTEMYLQTLIAYIDKGVPVILHGYGGPPFGVFVGYEEHGKILLYMTGDQTEPQRIPINVATGKDEDDNIRFGWIFVGEKKVQKDTKQIYRDVIHNLPKLLTTRTDTYCFGAEAFRAWAAEIELGRFDGMKPEQFDGWIMYTTYVCSLATNSGGCRSFLEKAQELNPDFTFLEDIRKLYRKTGYLWNDQNGEDLEAIGGGFNITLDALQDKNRRDKIVAKIREFADCIDEVVRILNKNLNI